MSIFAQRQFAIVLGAGAPASLADVATPLVPWRDVLPKYVLKLTDGKFNTGYFRRAVNTSNGIALPNNYSSTAQLAGVIIANGKAKVRVVSPTYGTSNVLLYGTKGSTLGDHRGIHAFVADTTSVTVLIPTALQGGADTLIEYAFWEVPDLTAAASWRDGLLALGVDA